MSAAADPRASAWVAANAGAGKTHTLANRVTRLLLAGARPEGILCLTYTKAAAAEMAGRLFDQLGRWSMLPDDELRQNIAAVGADVRGAEDLKEARRLFAKALETPGGLKIQTIHAFCQYVLMRFPLEAGVPASFRVLDDRSAADLMAEARARVLERAGAGDMERAAAIAYLVTHLSDFKLEQILDAALGADRNKLDAFLDRAAPEEWAALLRAAHGARPEDTPDSIARDFCATIAKEETVVREVVAWLSGGSGKDQERGLALASALELLGELERYDGFCQALLTKDGTLRATLATKALIKARPDLADYITALGNRLAECQDRWRAAQAAQLAEAALTVVAAVRDVYALEKKVRSALDYDDLIVETHRLLRQSGAAWVLFKLDQGIDHILIDEAQDTSSLQWDIIQSLTEEFFAGEGADRPVRTLFAVGDEKQSIFSFQGADPAQFDVRRRYFENHARQAGRQFLNEPLPVSRRSAPEILRFVDETFATPEARDGLTFTGAEIRHEPLRQVVGCVELWPTIKPSETPERDPWDLRPVDLERETSPVAQLADQIADRIKGWLTSGAALPGHTKPIAPGDIMILLPRREPFGSEIIRKLKERDVPVAGADRLRLNEQIAVMDLIALGRFALLPEDDLNLAALLRSPLVGLGEDDLFALAHGRKGTLWQALEGRREDYPEAHALLTETRARADFAPPFEFYAQALTEGRKKLLKRLGSEAGDPIDEFLALALAYENANTPSLEGFLHWVEGGGAEIKRDMERGRNEVRVMTVHGAKGLEADIVILPDTTRPPAASNRGNLLYTDEGVVYPMADKLASDKVKAAKRAAAEEALKEYRRLLYVALTRAKDRLIICGFENRLGNKPGSWHALTERAARTLGVEIARGDTTLYAYGDASEHKSGAAAEAAASTIDIPGWARSAPAMEHPSPWLIRPSLAAGMDEPAAAPKPQQRYQRGLLIHSLLARLPEVPPEQRAALAQRFLRARGVDAAGCEQLAAETLAVLDHPAFAPAFTPGSRAEVSLVADLPEIAPGARVHGRVDRLAVSDTTVLIVDFKTNRPPPARETDMPILYATQMALYRAAAARIFPGRRIVCALVWTDGPLLMPLSEGFLEAETGRIRARLDRAGSGS